MSKSDPTTGDTSNEAPAGTGARRDRSIDVTALEELEPLGLGMLRGVSEIINASSNGKTVLPTTSKRPLLLLGRLQYSDIIALKASTSLPFTYLAYLIGSEDGKPRAICAGQLPTSLREIISSSKYVTIVNGGVEVAAGIATLERAVVAVHVALACEAMALGVRTGINPQTLYSSIAGAAGSSRAFRRVIPDVLNGTVANDVQTGVAYHQAMSYLAEHQKLAGTVGFYSPLTALARQMFALVRHRANIAGSCGQVFGAYDADKWLENVPPVHDVTLPESVKPEKVAFVGLGAMGIGMATHLHRLGYNVSGFDVWKPSMDRFVAAGGTCATSIEECVTDASVLLLMVVNAKQAADVLFDGDAAKALPLNANIILMSTVSPTEARCLSSQISKLRPDLHLLDSPVSGGTPRAAIGDLTILCAGLETAGPLAGESLDVLKAMSQSKGNLANLVILPGGPGSGAAVKLVNQHLAGTHISSTMEALAFAAHLKLPLRQTRQLLLDGPAWSWMLDHRGKNMLDGLIQPPTSAINIFVKDLGIVVSEAESLGAGVPLASLAEQQFIFGKACGWGLDDDSSLIRVWDPTGNNPTCPE